VPGAVQIERTRVAWVDTDAGGRIHFTAAFRWAELAETALCRRLLVDTDAWGNFPRRAVEAEYLSVLRFDDEVEIELRAEAVGRSSVTYGWDIRRGGELCIRGSHTVVHVDGEGKPTPLPDEFRAALTAG
jgi:YbgC/YbaW family acyl-CoA thioester hydrolase